MTTTTPAYTRNTIRRRYLPNPARLQEASALIGTIGRIQHGRNPYVAYPTISYSDSIFAPTPAECLREYQEFMRQAGAYEYMQVFAYNASPHVWEWSVDYITRGGLYYRISFLVSSAWKPTA